MFDIVYQLQSLVLVSGHYFCKFGNTFDDFKKKSPLAHPSLFLIF